MKNLRCTLLSDGSSDRMLLPVIDWLLECHCPDLTVESAWADLGKLRRPPKVLSDKITLTLDLYPCDILFIHRDAERMQHQVRVLEIKGALKGIKAPPVVSVIPVRMLEAWFLFNEPAIRIAAGNPRGQNRLDLPCLGTIDSVPDPKEILYNLIRDSSGRHGTRLKKLNLPQCAFRVSQCIDDFSPLRSQAAFQAMEQELIEALVASGVASAAEN